MGFIGKSTFNVNGIIVHSNLHISINQSLSNISKLSSEILNSRTNHCQQLCFVVIDENSLVGAKLFNVIGSRLWDLKHMHNICMWRFFYQAFLLQNVWIFQKSFEGLRGVAPIFWSRDQNQMLRIDCCNVSKWHKI